VLSYKRNINTTCREFYRGWKLVWQLKLDTFNIHGNCNGVRLYNFDLNDVILLCGCRDVLSTPKSLERCKLWHADTTVISLWRRNMTAQFRFEIPSDCWENYKKNLTGVTFLPHSVRNRSTSSVTVWSTFQRKWPKTDTKYPIISATCHFSDCVAFITENTSWHISTTNFHYISVFNFHCHLSFLLFVVHFSRGQHCVAVSIFYIIHSCTVPPPFFFGEWSWNIIIMVARLRLMYSFAVEITEMIALITLFVNIRTK